MKIMVQAQAIESAKIAAVNGSNDDVETVRRVGKGVLATCPPSIAERASGWWARCRFAHYGLICFSGKRNLDARPATNWHDGQITKSLSSPVCKNIPLPSSGKSVP